jgi:LL-diaminopimelate aminotransferase
VTEKGKQREENRERKQRKENRMIPNTNYSQLKDSYLFYHIAQKTGAYLEEHPGARLYRMGIGDVSRPLCGAVIRALHEAVEDQARAATFHGYMPECGDPALRRRIAEYYQNRGVSLLPEEVFVSSGASDELGDILDLFGRDKTVLIMEPAYPAYVDANVMAGNRILHLPAGRENGFLPVPDPSLQADIIYICSPNNPTGAVFDCEKLKTWVDYARSTDAVILFDGAYEAFIEDEKLPHSIFEIEGARECAIEICSLSKTAGFTGTRCGYTVIPRELSRGGMNLNRMWVRNRTTRTNGVSYVIQKGAEAVFSEKGQKQIRENIRIYKENAVCLMDALDRLGIWYCGGKNAPYIWMKCPDSMGSWEFFDYLLQELQIVGTPGAGFGACGEGYFRFSTFGSQEDTREAARRLLAARELRLR